MSTDDRLPDGNLPSKEREIHGTRYRVDRLDWWGVQDVIAMLVDVLGPSLCSVVDGISSEGLTAILDAKDGGAKLGEAITGALSRITGQRGRELQERLGIQTLVWTDDRWVVLQREKLGIWLSQHPADLVEWLRFALEVQLADFFGPALAALASLRASKKGVETKAPTSPRSPNI